MGRFDVIVVGCGAMGSSISYNLARRGLKVVTLEQFNLGHELGSSHGRTRIIRLAYYEDPRYVPLLKRAWSGWRELQGASGEELLRLTGCLSVGAEAGEHIVGVLASARAHGLPHRRLTARDVGDEFPAFRVQEDQVAVYEENGGILFPEKCVGAFVGLAREGGCGFRFSERVVGWRREGARLRVETSKGAYSSYKVVICAGPWMGKLTGGLLPLRVERQVPFWFSSGGQKRFGAEEMPVFIMEEGAGYFYGIPDVGHGVKVARHHGGASVDPDQVDREVTEDDSAPVERFVSMRLPGLALPYEAATTCLYTDTPDLNFAVGLHPEDRDVVLVSACSGHGFKFAPVMGEVAADLAVSGKSSSDVSFLGLDRFRG